jgi:hypothetical protein
MAEEEIQVLKSNVDRVVEFKTIEGEELVAKVIFAAYAEEFMVPIQFRR